MNWNRVYDLVKKIPRGRVMTYGQVAKALRLPQWSPPDWLNRKLWLVKYGVAALVIVLGFLSPDSASKASEVEPFKTAITSMFTRPWPYEVYAGFLLAVWLFTERWT